MSRRLIVALLAFGAPVVASAQSITGIVTNGAGRPLAGVLVEVDGARPQSAATAADGRYRLNRVEPGAHTLRFRYVGFVPQNRPVTVPATGTVALDLSFDKTIPKLEAMTITGQVAGQAAALNQQRSNDKISSVVDNELVGRLPDQNMADALQRLPGVAVDKDQGEGRYVQIRGTRPDLNALSVNGVRIPTPENSGSSVSGNNSSGRALPMDVVPSDQAATIEVSKTLTADLDADAIGGNVNIVTRSARGAPKFSLSLAKGQNVLYGRPITNGTLNLGTRFGTDDRWGIQVGGTYYQNSRASQNFEGSWCVQNGDCGAATDASLASLNAPRGWETRNYPVVDRLRQGVNTTLDRYLANGGKLSLRASLSSFADAETRYRTRYTFRAGGGSRWNMISADSGTTTGSRMDRDVRFRELQWRMGTVQLAGDHTLAGGKQLDWSLSTARASDNRPNTRTLVFRQSNMGFAYNFADDERPRVYVTTGAADDPTKFTFNSFTKEVRKIEDNDLGSRVNLTLPAAFAGGNGTVKLGLATRNKERTNRITTTVSTNALGNNSLNATGATLFSTLVGATQPVRIFGDAYNMGPQPSSSAAEAFMAANLHAFTTDKFNSDLPTAGASFKVREDVYAGYAMASMEWGRLRLIPGVRVEATRVNTDANRVSVSGTTLTVTPTKGSSNYTSVFPSLTANFRVSDNTVLRGAVTTSLARPNFGDLAPTTQTTSGQTTATIGNPALKPTQALNYDVMAEHYFESVGFVSLGAFYKDLTNFIYPQTRAPLASEALPAEVTLVVTPVNGPSGKIYGLEAAWQQKLTFLPGLLDGLGLNLNYTYSKSESTFPLRGSEKFSIPGQTGTAGNAGIFYDKGPLSLRTGVNYAGKFRVTVSPLGKDADTYRLERTQVDVAGSYQIRADTKFFIEGINLTNTPFRGSVGDRDNRGGGGDDPSREIYKPWWMVGIRIGN